MVQTDILRRSQRPTDDRRKKLAVFDMDGVLTTHPSSWEFVHRYAQVSNEEARELYEKSLISYSDFLKSDVRLWISSGKVRTHSDLVRILSGIPVTAGAVETVESIRKMGFVTAIISGGLYDLVDLIDPQHRLFDFVFANRVAVDAGGYLVPDGQIMVEPMEKGTVLRKLQQDLSIGAENTMSVGDSVQDIPMFRMSKISVAVGSGNSEIAGIAKYVVPREDFRKITRLATEV
ncbi:MAG: HAD-IB family phosphatase [Thermoplasmataceae archaeon]